jgi:hypothetical protein
MSDVVRASLSNTSCVRFIFFRSIIALPRSVSSRLNFRPARSGAQSTKSASLDGEVENLTLKGVGASFWASQPSLWSPPERGSFREYWPFRAGAGFPLSTRRQSKFEVSFRPRFGGSREP